ncbi:hypothetical protein CALCODRAFT_497389 [Calocera cornea HHB12733]|uniref:Uncharacterized protein n=1 Tax=Calocera cornea HHB12733 TaxID=1353952 RepID=A0A165FAX2_9BASI|nr:hypothetical protein CALCODRAFT_497389 [Calocera cornea HHB12733]
MEYWPVLFLKAHRAAEQWRLLQGAAPSRIAESFPQMSEQELAERERKRLGQMEVLRKECVDALEFGWKKGVHLCANYMGELYAHGWVVRRSGKMARQWWEWAAENGSVQAMKHLGRHLGVFRDPTKRRLMHVQVDLALSYNKQAAPWSGTAAHQAAQYYWRPVGETRAHHRQRWGVEADDEEAAKWFYYGVRTGHVYCRLGLARMMLEKRVKLDQLAQWEVERLELLARDDPDASETTEWDEVATDENGAPDPLAAPEMDVYLLHAAGIKRAVKVQHRLNPDGSITTNKYEVFVGEYGNPEDVKYARRLQKQNKRVKREGGTARWAVKHHLELGGGVENQTTTQFEEELEMGLEDHDELEQVHDAPRKQEVEDFTDGFDIPSHLLTGNSGNPARSPHAYLDTGFNLVMTSEAEMLADARKRVEEWMLHLRCAGALIDGVPISDRRPLPGPLPDPLPGTGLATWPAPWSSPGTTVAKVGDDTLFGRGRDRRAEVESLQRLLRKQERQAGELLGDERALKEWRRGQERGERKLCNRLAPPSEREQRDEQEQDPIAKWRRPEQHEAIAPMRYGAKKSRQMRGLMDVLALNGRDEVEMEMEFEADPADKTVSVYSPSLPFSASGRSAVHSIASAGTRESERERRRGRPKATNQGLQSLVSVLAQNGREVESDPSASPSHSPFPEPEPEPLHQRSPSQVPSPSSRTRGGVSGTSERGGRKWEDQRDVFEDVLGL